MSEEAPPTTSETTLAILADRRDNAKRILGDNYAARIDPICEKIRAATMDGLTLEGAFAKLAPTNPPTEFIFWSASLLECQEKATPSPAERLTQAEGQAPVKPPKGKRKKEPKPRKLGHGWAKRIGAGTRLAVPELTDPATAKSEIERVLKALAFRADETPVERRAGACAPWWALDVSFSNIQDLIFHDVVCFGWRVETRKFSKGLLDARLEDAIRKYHAENEGRWPGPAVKKSLKEDVVDDLIRAARPQIVMTTITWEVKEGWVLVQGPPKVVEEIRIKFSSLLKHCRVASIGRLNEQQQEILGKIDNFSDLRKPYPTPPAQHAFPRERFVYSDMMLWLALGGSLSVGEITRENPERRYSINGACKLQSPKLQAGTAEVSVKSHELGALHASLAEGASFRAVDLELSEKYPAPNGEDEDGNPVTTMIGRTFSVTLEAKNTSFSDRLAISSVSIGKASNSSEASSIVWERVNAYKHFWKMLEDVFSRFVQARTSDEWPAFWNRARQWVGLEMARRFQFQANGQGWLFGAPPKQLETK